MAPEYVEQVQTTSSETNESQLGCINAIPTLQAEPVPTWLDQLLWYRQRLSTLCRSRSMDSAQGQNGLLATVAQATNQGKKLDETRCACAVSSCVMAGSSFTILSETPCADPPVRRIGAGCCGG